jgi:hypothetical protein
VCDLIEEEWEKKLFSLHPSGRAEEREEKEDFCRISVGQKKSRKKQTFFLIKITIHEMDGNDETNKQKSLPPRT